MGSRYTGSISNFKERYQQLGETKDKASRISEWLSGVDLMKKEDISTTTNQIQSSYDDVLNEAYANYKKRQISNDKMSNILEGFNRPYQQELTSAFKDANKNLQTDKLDAISKIEEAYKKNYYQPHEKELTEKAELSQKLQQALYDFSGQTDQDYIKQGFFDTIIDENGKPMYEQTKIGRQYFDDLLNKGLYDEDLGDYITFGEYLSEQDAYLYNAYMEDPDTYKELFLGQKEDNYTNDLSRMAPADIITKITNDYNIVDKNGIYPRSPEDFGLDVIGSGNANSAQNKYLQKLIDNPPKNGEIVDLNKGLGKAKYLYYNGRYFKLEKIGS